jgi:TM2 domain-containing membrane protein YozV
MYCGRCGNEMKDDQQFCDKCGQKLGEMKNPQYQIYVKEKSAGVAAVLSFFIAGLGQLYVGKIQRGVIILIVYIMLGILSYALLFTMVTDIFNITEDTFSIDTGVFAVILLLGVISFIIWIWNIFDAYKLANEYNDSVRAGGNRPW